MKTKMIKTLVMALGLFACAHSFADGNIYEIVPCTQNGMALSGPIASVKNPLVAGETVYFKLRMPRTLDMKLAGKQWTLVHHGMSDIIDDFFSPLMIGIYVSGQLTYARYVNYVDSSSDIRDFIFSYTTKPGDFALPIRLAGDGGPVGYSDSSSEYLLMNSDKWTVEDGNGNAAVFQYGSTFDVPVSPSTSSGRQLDYSLAKAGFYVRSIGFDPAWESAAYWRMVHSGSTFTDSLTPRLVADSAPTNAVTLHVWSMNEDIIKIKGGREVEMTVAYEGGLPVKQTVHVGDVTFATGQTQVNFADMGFELEGGDQLYVGQFTNLVLSAYEDYSYDKLGVRQVDYVTVPVQCSEALPPTLIVDVDVATVVAPVREDGDMYRSTAQVSVYLSQAYDYPLEVTVTPSFAHGAWGDYVRFSKTQTETSVLPTATAPTVIIPANSTGKQTLFLYALRADENTQGDENNQIVLTPSFDDTAAAAVITEIQKAGVWISAAKPEIRTPSAGAEISSVSGDEYELTVAVADTVADLADTTTGYQVWFKAGATAKGGFLDGYWIMKDGALVNKDDNSPLKVTYPSSGDQQSQIYVVSPISKKKSDPVTFTAHIAEARTSTVETTDGTGNVYNEGDQATFKVTLSDKNETGGTIYAFLKASDNAVAGMFSGTPLFVVCNDTDPTKTQGLAINKNQIATPESKIKLLDGLSEDAGGLSLTFEVILCTTPQYSDDPNNRVAGYDSNYLNLTVFNVEPIIKRIEMNGFESEYDGYQFATVPKGMWQKFKAVVADKGAYDLETNFKTKWTVSRNGQQKGNLEIVGNPNDDANVYSNNFTQAGTWVVKCQVKDKDMDDWSDITYSVTFEVLDSPHVTLAVEETYFEDNDRAKITVGLDYWDDNRIEPLVVRLAVSPYSDRPNPGLFKLDQRYFKETVGQIDYYEVALTGDDYSAFDIDVVELDGTSNAKFSIAGEVVTTDELPTSETPANEYYLAASKVLYVEDVLPVCTITPDPAATTNRIEVSGGLSNYTIRWNVRSDVDNDFSYTYAKWPEAGIKVTFGGCENAADGSTIITEPTSGEFKPNFGDAQGPVEVTLTIETKDGPLDTFTWYFYVRPSKFLKTYAAGPLDPKSQYGAGLEGLGSGHVVVRGGATTFSSATKYVMDWNCGMETDVSGYAFGYKVSDDETNPTLDNGGLDDGFDVAIDFAGNNDNTPIANYYTYAPADGKDSFFYLWVNITPDENGNPVDTPIGKIAPEIPGRDRSPQALRLPTEMTGDGTAYLKTHVEAIFSREYAVEDNLGDLNNDGIPDYLAVCHKWAGGILAEVVYGDFMENHWRPLDQTNIDEDYIPGVWQQSIEGNALEFKELASYSPYLKTAEPFKTFFEIRGFGGGLNYIDDNGMVISKPAFSEVEQKAWEAFVEANNDGKADTDPDWLDVTKPDLTKWSPVPRGNKKLRMDPTLEDTDGDGKPDGWEYFFWYMAKVWAPAASKPGTKKDGQLFVFERFNPNDIVRGIEIKAEDVLKRFHPCVDDRIGVKDYNPDFDGDGLTDLEELVIGTNPCHWDTDADHMCDGWEIMHSLDPLNGSKVDNPDGDFMAYMELSRYFAVEVLNNNAPTTYVFDLGMELREGRDYETTDIPMYAMKEYYDSHGFYIQTASPKDDNGDDNYPLYYYLDGDTLRYTIEETDPDGNPTERYTTVGSITIRDVPLTAALIAPAKLDANNRPYLYGLETDAPPVPIPPVWHWSYPMLDHKLLSADDGLPLFRRGAYTIPADTLLIHTSHILIHDQVHAAFGFDPRTGWYKNGAGYVADRWNPQINLDLAPTDSTGLAVNTDPYTDYDEYLVMRYRHDFGIQYYNDGKYDPGDIWSTFLAFTTKPNVVYAKTDIEAILNPTNGTESATTNGTESATTYDTETAANLLATANISEYLANAFAEAGSTRSPVKGHGADTDGDGVPDGWELYKYRNPNAAPSRPTAVGQEGFSEPWDKEELDGTPDGLGWTAEYAGTDSCNAYKDCPSIYNNHPGLHPAGEGFQQGWFNKFFPTDPDNPDTDGDGIFDGYEGLAWRGTWYNGGNTYIVAPTTAGMTFIYGNPQDSITCCVRGGGMNPCTVDTDIDGLPDPWEMSYAGIVVDATARKYVGPADGFDPDIAEATFISDGFNEAGVTISNVVYICGGMDATWGGDAWTDPIEDGNSTDPLLGTRRDVDFDHDGLQNYQEYLVQQVRHFRYDDITTPLMGRYLDEGEYDPLNPTGPLLSNHVHNQAPSFTPMMQDADQFVMRTLQNWMDGVGVSFVTNVVGRTITVNEFTGDEMTNLVYEVVTNIAQGSTIVADKYYGDGYHYMFSTPWVAAGWRKNGYMASPIHYWDRMITCDVIQPSILMPPAGAYVSTDPRVADTDGDGMDDYYEMFHGLNPILGSTGAGAKDIIAQAWGSPTFFNAFWNEWTHEDFNRIAALMGMPGSIADPTPLQAPAALDPLLYPWAMGAGEADPDGDGLRNDSERVTANLTSPMSTHTDPTPLWFTDSSSPNSYASQYYLNTTPVTAMPFWPLLVGFDDPYSPQTPDGGYGGFGYLYAFEENEGYDTDNDWKSDGHEIITTTRPGSDPLDFSDPARRQALYLDGNRSWVQSRAMFMRDIFEGKEPSATTVDFFKQFTVEAWIRPEKKAAQTILDRCSLYGYDAINKNEAAIRSNFRLGLTADGRVYGMFDNDDARDSGDNDTVSCQTVDGPEVPLNEWTHVAMTYDGKALLLYVNGIERGRKPTSLIPANGVTVIIQDPTYTNTFTQLSYEAVPGAFFIGGRPLPAGDGGAAAFDTATITYDAMNGDEWFKGYVDEVRIWDGVRTASEISANYAKKMTKADASANREEVYTHLMSPNADASRNDNDGKLRLTAELVQLYDFTTLPGAVNAADVATNPMGFGTAVRGQLVSKPDTFSENIGWWDACATKSTVYTDYAVMPWIENTVHHLPVMDGSVVDSFLYSDYLGGYTTTAAQHELSKYALNNSAMPYPYHNYFLERYQRLFKLNLLAQTDPENFLLEDLVCRYEYEIRSDFIGTADLVPMGGAYSKTCPAMWDGNGVADAWEYTSVDTDVDGLPDWWEEKYGLDPASSYDWNSVVDWNGAQLPAYIAYGVDLALGMQPDGEYHPEYASTVDIDADNIPDWWENLFGVAGYGANDDPDNDGLPNYAEYIVSFGPYPYGVTNGWEFISPLNAYSAKADQRVPDYYLRAPKAFDDSGRHINANEYYGEIVTDHDFMESWWEKMHPLAYVNAHVYDPDKDVDGDGWDNWSEARAFMWSGSFVADMIDRWFSSDADHAKCYPEPALGLRITYNGIQDITSRGIVVRTTTGQSPRVDATFVVPGSDSGVAVKSKIIGGYYSDATLHGFLNPGQLIPGSGRFSMARLSSDRQYVWNYLWYTEQNGYSPLSYNALPGYGMGTLEEYREQLARYPHIELEDASISWELFATTVADAQGHHGIIYYSASNSTTRAELGEINYRTGEYSLDVGMLAAARGESLDGVLFSVDYESRIAQNWPQSIWVSEATTGRVKEGLNTIEAWIDLNPDGVYTPGEPYGVVRNVNVGWHKTAETVIELRDTSSTIPRYLLADGSSDRAVVKGISSGVLPAEAAAGGEGGGASIAAAGLTANVVVRRVSLNGQQKIGDKTVPERILVSKTVVLDDRAYLTEADVLSDDKFDLDWKWLAKDAEKLGITGADLKTAEYEISSVAMLPDGSSTNLALSTFVNRFNAQRVKPAPVSPTLVSPVYSTSPTFTFTSPDDTMTAFRLQVSTSTNATDVVYDSGIRTLPGRVPTTVGTVGCTFTPQLYVNDPVATNGAPVFVDGSNYFWRVTLMNAKYNSPDAGWGEWAEFQMDVANENRYPKLPTGYGKCGAVVRYFGPGEAPEGQVVVEVHRSADFAGQPLAQLRADVSQLDDIDDIDTVNAAFAGIEPGSVYLMAYIDTNNNGRRDVNESWGYANYIGTAQLSIYTPCGVTVTDELYLTGEPPKVVVFIEDTDINRNEIPDCLEDADDGSSSAASGDTDRDGLLDEEEPSYATEATIWDTDGDGMPDGWEVKFADLDPNFDDAVEAAEGDVMAFVKQDCTIVTVRNTDGSDPVNFILKAGQKVPAVGDSIDGYELYVPYDYPVVTSNGVENCYGRGTAVQLEAAAGTENRVIAVSPGTVVLVHAQVYDEFGFNSLTANPVAFADGTAVNTKEFTALDKYLVIRYLEALGLCSEDDVNVNRKWAQYSLKPLDIDNDLDGMADGWELYVMFGHGGVQPLTTDPSLDVINPWAFRDRALDADGDRLANVLEYDRGNFPSDPWDIDTDGDGVIDVYAWAYHLKGDQAGEDPDGDGLSNYAEYLISEVFKIVALDPDNATTSDSTLDYYRKFGELYLGEVFTDHDRVDDDWEADYEFGNTDSIVYAARGIYDPDADLDGDGWSNYAEYRAGTSPAKQTDTGIDNYTLVEHPVPVVEMEVVYNGTADIEGRTLVVKAWNEKLDPDALSAPNATWNITTLNEAGTATQQNAETEEEVREKYIGRMPTGKRTYYLTGGAVKEGSFKLSIKDKNYVEGEVVTLEGQNYFMPTGYGDPDTALWFYDIIDHEGVLVTRGGIFAEAHAVGTIDYKSGRVTINFDDEEFTREILVGDSAESQSGGNNGNDGATYHGLHPADSYVKFTWAPVISVPVRGIHYLGDTAAGFLREGQTTFIVEAQTSTASDGTGGNEGNGGNNEEGQDSTTFNNSHVMGIVRHVDVGWAGAKFKVELTDFNPITPRVDMRAGTFDRAEPLVTTDSRINVGSNVVAEATTAGSLVRVRVVRYAINGYPIATTWGSGLADVVYDKTGTWDRMFCELDSLLDDKFDVDWTDSFTDKVANLNGVTRGSEGEAGNIAQVVGVGPSITNIQYMVVIGDGDVTWERPDSTNTVNALPYLITRHFDYNRAAPVAVNVDGIQYSARPTFTWRMSGEEADVKRFGSSYTAFKLQVKKGNVLVYSSGTLRAPATDKDGNFKWTAPICCGGLYEKGQLFGTSDTYTWQVTMYNAKFRSDSWSVQSVFSTAVNAQQELNDHGYSSIGVFVKYAGPSIVLGKYADMTTKQGKVIVQAFAKPDFSGEPLAQGLATADVENLANIVEPNAWLKGLPAIGTYYIRAFIDMDGEGDLDEWEPWGYVKDEVTLVNDGTMAKAPLVSVWIEDSDSDRDWIPDAYEYAAKGWTVSWETLKGNTKNQPGGVVSVLPDGGIVLTIPIDQLTSAGISKGLPVASLTAMQSAEFAAALLGLDLTNKTTLEAIAEATKGKLVPNSVRVVSIVIEPDGSAVNLVVNADVASGIAGTVVSQYYSFVGSDTVKVLVKVWKKDSLEDANWTVVYTSPEPVSITPQTDETVVVPFDSQLDLSSGFFKVELVEVLP